MPQDPDRITLIGTVKWFSDQKGFGFITITGHQDHFFHVSQIMDAKQLEKGDTVKFISAKSQAGKRQAREVMLLKKQEIIPRGYQKGQDGRFYATYEGPRMTGAGVVVGALLGGPIGGAIGGMLGSALGGIEQRFELGLDRTCLRCGAEARLTAETDTHYGLKCPSCGRFWKARKDSLY